MAALLEPQLDDLLARRQLELLEARDLGGRERFRRHVGEGRAAEERERLFGLPLADEALEPQRVDLLRRDVEEVARCARLDRRAAEELSQLRDVALERVRGAGRRVLAPQPVDEPVLRQHPARIEREDREQGAQLLATDLDRPLAVSCFERAEQADLKHAGRRCSRAAAL